MATRPLRSRLLTAVVLAAVAWFAGSCGTVAGTLMLRGLLTPDACYEEYEEPAPDPIA